MKLVTCLCPAQPRRQRLGMLVDRDGSSFVLDLTRTRAWAFPLSSHAPIPSDMLTFIRHGAKGFALARRVVATALDRWDELPLGAATPLERVHLTAPITRPGKIICPGMNFRKHLEETRGKDAKNPEFPLGFFKTTGCVTGPGAPISIPPWTQKLDYEVELAVIIGVGGSNISRERAMSHVAGYTIMNDVSARDVQLIEMKNGFLALGKNFPGSCPLGPYLLTADELPDPHTLSMELRVNGELRQQGHSSDLIYNFADLISYWSRIGLEPGDVIASGTPSGVALGKEPDTSWYLKPGDVMEASIERLGTLRNSIAAK